MRARRPEGLPNIGFASQLQQLEHELHPPRPSGEQASLTRYLREVCQVPASAHDLQAHQFDGVQAVRWLFDGEIPRVVQGAQPLTPSGSSVVQEQQEPGGAGG